MARKRERSDENESAENGAPFSGKIATPEVEKYLAKDGPEGVNVNTGWTSKTIGTGKFNDA